MILPTAGALLVMGGILGGGWGAKEYLDSNFASRSEFVIVAGTASLLMDARIAELIQKRDEIKRKKHKDANDRQDIDYYNKQIERLQQIQREKAK